MPQKIWKIEKYEKSFITIQCTKVRLCSEGVTKVFPKGFDRQNSIFLHPNGKRKPAPELHLSALNFESSRAIFLHFFNKNLIFEQFFQTIGLFEHVNLVLKLL